MARSPELGELFDLVGSLNMSRVVSKGIVTVCRHTGPRRARCGGHGIGADIDGHLSFDQVIHVCIEKNLIGRIPH
eukprot:4803771-Lingulodinium_polyedra.AAC.1